MELAFHMQQSLFLTESVMPALKNDFNKLGDIHKDALMPVITQIPGIDRSPIRQSFHRVNVGGRKTVFGDPQHSVPLF